MKSKDWCGIITDEGNQYYTNGNKSKWVLPISYINRDEYSDSDYESSDENDENDDENEDNEKEEDFDYTNTDNENNNYGKVLSALKKFAPNSVFPEESNKLKLNRIYDTKFISFFNFVLKDSLFNLYFCKEQVQLKLSEMMISWKYILNGEEHI